MRVHFKGSSTFCCNSDAPCDEHAEKYLPTQSDESALSEARTLLVECMIPLEALRAVECQINGKALCDDLKKEIIHVTDKVRALLSGASGAAGKGGAE